MEHRKFSVYEALGWAFKGVFDNFRLFFVILLSYLGFLLITLIAIIMTVGMSSIMYFKDTMPTMMQSCQGQTCPGAGQQLQTMLASVLRILPIGSLLLLGCVTWIVFYGLSLGYKRIALDVYDSGDSAVMRLFSCFNLVPKAIIANLIFVIAVFFASLLFLIPGIYLFERLGLFSFFIVDKNAGIIESLKMSFEATRGQVWHLVCLSIIISLLSLTVGGLGILFIMPVHQLAFAYVYRKVTAHTLSL